MPWHPCKLARLLRVLWQQLLLCELNKFYWYFQIVFMSNKFVVKKLKPFIEVHYLALFFRHLDSKLALFL